MVRDDINPKSKSEDERESPKYFRRPKEEEATNLTDVLMGLVQRLKNLDRERTDLTQEIERLGEEAEKEAEDMEKELSTLKDQAVALKDVLESMRSRRR